MASEQMQQLAALFGSGRERFSRNNVGLQDVRDICEGLHAASAEPEGVTYAEVDAGGVPALWCIPAECDAHELADVGADLFDQIGGRGSISVLSKT
jgi:hypothetical protein